MKSEQSSSSADRPQPSPGATQHSVAPEGETLRAVPAEASVTLTRESAAPTPASSSPTLPEHLPASFGRYQLVKLLGRGGMGVVYLAQDSQLDRAVALKVPHFTAAEGPHLRERFLREARAAAGLRHANICPVYDVGELDGIPYLTMAYIEGRSLAEMLRGDWKPLPPPRAAALVHKLALALTEAHSHQIIHRDLKPGNIMLTADGEPVLMDFGLARRDDSGDIRLTQQGAVLGTPAYMAPEQAKGDSHTVGPRCDIYSLGVLLYELLTHRLPFRGVDTFAVLAKVMTEAPPPPSQHQPDVDAKIEAICLKAMAKEPSDRYPAMADFAAALADYLQEADQTLAAKPRPPITQSSAPPRGGRALGIALTAGVLVFLLGAGAIFLLIGNKGTDENKPDGEPPADRKNGAAVAALPAVAVPPAGWPEQAVRDGRVLAPDLSQLEPRFHLDYSTFAPGGGERQGYEKGIYYIANGFFWNQWDKEDVSSLVCRVVGRTTGPGAWALSLCDKQDMCGLEIHIGGDQTFRITPARWREQGNPCVETPWTHHAAFHKDAAYNTLLVILRDRLLEVYVNQHAVCRPLLLDRDLTPLVLQLGAIGNRGAGRAEFREFTVWPHLDGVPPASARQVIESWPTPPDLSDVKPLFQDAFGDPASGFPKGKGPRGAEFGYRDGRYFITVPAGIVRYCLAPLGNARLAGDFACEMVGRVTGEAIHWGLNIVEGETPRDRRRLSLSIDNVGQLRLFRGDRNGEKPLQPPLKHPAIKKGNNVANTLRMVLRGRVLQIYVNAAAVCEPIVLEHAVSSPSLALAASGGPLKGGTATFERITVWPLDGNSTPKKGEDAPKP
jgi:predicted Ser/Thr protein kinase